MTNGQDSMASLQGDDLILLEKMLFKHVAMASPVSFEYQMVNKAIQQEIQQEEIQEAQQEEAQQQEIQQQATSAALAEQATAAVAEQAAAALPELACGSCAGRAVVEFHAATQG